MHSLRVASDCCASSGGATDGAADGPGTFSTTGQLCLVARRVADWSGPLETHDERGALRGSAAWSQVICSGMNGGVAVSRNNYKNATKLLRNARTTAVIRLSFPCGIGVLYFESGHRPASPHMRTVHCYLPPAPVFPPNPVIMANPPVNYINYVKLHFTYVSDRELN